jgi:hypothetical protein
LPHFGLGGVMSAYHTERMRSKEVIFHHQVGNSFNLTIIAEDKCERSQSSARIFLYNYESS